MIDIGTGDGRAVLRAARNAPDRFVIGVDPNARAMAVASRRAARGGVLNALFLAASLESLPPELAGRAGLVRVNLPWGSLLRGLVAGDPATHAALSSLVAPGGRLELLVSLTERDRPAGMALIGRSERATLSRAAMRGILRRFQGFSVEEMRPATAADVVASGSSWAKRLGIPGRREAWIGRLRRGFPSEGRIGAAIESCRDIE